MSEMKRFSINKLLTRIHKWLWDRRWFKGDELWNLLYRKTEAMRAEAIQSVEPIPADRLDSLERIAKLGEISETARSKSTRRRRWAFIIPFLIIVLVSAATISHVRTTEIELDITVSEVNFVLPEPKELIDGMSLSALGMTGHTAIQFPDIEESQTIHPAEGEEVNLFLGTASLAGRRGEINLVNLSLPKETEVRLHRTRVQNQYNLILTPPSNSQLKLEASVSGPIQIRQSDSPEKLLDFEKPKAVVLQSVSGGVSLDLTFGKEARASLSPLTATNRLSFFSAPDPTGTTQPRPTILSGDLYLESLNGQKLTLRPGEALPFSLEKGDGVIRTLELRDDAIAMKFHGIVSYLRAGVGQRSRNLMPTYLQTLREHQPLALFWGALIGGLSLISSLWKK